jgi:hypothetical protein
MPRTRKEPPAEPPAPAPAGGSARRWLVEVLLPLALGAALLGGVVVLGRYLTSRMEDAGEATIAFADIECDAPPGMTRADFLDQAQYLAGLPDRLAATAPATRHRIFDALALHPWVARVRRVEFPVTGEARADLEFRRPALAVPPDRVVDGEGILLPAGAGADGLPRLRGKVRAPGARAGQVWDDPAVVAAARVAALLRDELARRGVPCEIEVGPDAIALDLGGVRVLWGSAPGRESPGEAAAAVKVRRLAEAGALDGMRWDLRPEGGMRREPRE